MRGPGQMPAKGGTRKPVRKSEVHKEISSKLPLYHSIFDSGSEKKSCLSPERVLKRLGTKPCDGGLSFLALMNVSSKLVSDVLH